MRVETGELRPEEAHEAGRATADAYLEFAPAEAAADPRGLWGYYGRIANVASRAARTTVLVARNADTQEVLGSLTLEMDHHIDESLPPLPTGMAHIRMFGIAPEARGQGAGRALMQACIEHCRGAGKEVLTLHTTELMQSAQNLYRSLGFKRGEDEQMDDGEVLLSYSMELIPLRRTERRPASAPPPSCL